MKKFRHWFFKLLTGYDLIEYEDILRKWSETLKDMEDIHDTNGKLLKHSSECIALAKKANTECILTLSYLKERNLNETLD